MNSAALQGRWQRAPVIVVGAHRSGTTATVRALEDLGLQVGQRLDSHREPKALQRLHEDYLVQHGAAWHRPAPFLDWIKSEEGERDCTEYLKNHSRREFARIFGYRKNPSGLFLLARLKLGAAWGWKEPRTTLFASSWLRLFPRARVIEVIRHPLAVAMSIRKRELKFRAAGDRPKTELDDLDYCVRLALTYVEVGGRLSDRAGSYQRVRFEDMQANPGRTLEALAHFCALHPTRAQIAQAAATIRPENPNQWDGLSKEAASELLSRYSMVAKLGYGTL